MDLISLGLAVRSARTKSGISGKQLAERTGLRATEISKIENGKRILNFRSAFLIAQALRISLDDLANIARELDKKGQRKQAERVAKLELELRNLKRSLGEKLKSV
jgi:transcriptional regulator with XRE-family HTH domain